MQAQAPERIEIRPQRGPQEAFLANAADVVIYGGAAGGGKTYALLLEPLRHMSNPGFGAVIFRRTSPQIRALGGPWDTSATIYPLFGAKSNETDLFWRFSSGAEVKFAHMQYESDRFNWQGSQITLLAFDELTHFTQAQFFYLLGRNRSTCGVRPYVRATCNPDPDSWVAEFIAWWIDQETGYPIPERSGVLRWFIRVNDQLLWADSREELVSDYPDSQPKSATFIPSKLSDNRVLMQRDPGYLGNLMALPLVERERLLGGNWKIRPAAGLYFPRHRFVIADAAPAGLTWVRFWDLAATEVKDGNDPDWVAGGKLAVDDDGFTWIADMRHLRGSPHDVEQLIAQTAALDGKDVDIYFEQEPGSSGKALIDQYRRRVLQGYSVNVLVASTRGNKIALASPLSSQVEAGNVRLVNGDWIPAFLDEAERFPDGAHDDQVDAVSSAYAVVTGSAWREKTAKRRVQAGLRQQVDSRMATCSRCQTANWFPAGAQVMNCSGCGLELHRGIAAAAG